MPRPAAGHNKPGDEMNPLQFAMMALMSVAAAAGLSAEKPASLMPCRCEPDRRLAVTKPMLKGEDIKGLQDYLTHLGYHPGPADGIYGSATAAAVKEFQQHNRLRADGVVAGAVWQALGQEPAGRDKAIPARSGGVVLIVDTRLATLWVWQDGRILAEYPIALGKRETPTPLGTYRIKFKSKWSGGFGTRFLGLDVPWGIYGIHGTNKPWSIGNYASHGCIRLFNRDIEQLYRLVVPGTAVHIIGDPFYGTTRLGKGDNGAPAAFLQRRLKQLGFYRGRDDGYYGPATESAVKSFQRSSGLPVTGIVGLAEIRALKLRPTD